jgi:hypothetical protein
MRRRWTRRLVASSLAALTGREHETAVEALRALAERTTSKLEGMFVGIRAVDADSKGTLIQVALPFAIALLKQIDSISIRD